MLWAPCWGEAVRGVQRDIWLAARSTSAAPNEDRRDIPGYHKSRIARQRTERRRTAIHPRQGGFNQRFHDSRRLPCTLEDPERYQQTGLEGREREPGLLRHYTETTWNHRVRIRHDDHTCGVRQGPVQSPDRPKPERARSELKTTPSLCSARRA